MKELNLPAKVTVLAAVMASLLAGALPAMAQEEGERERQDMNIGNSGQLRTGQDERGNEVMEIRPKPKTQQEMPNIGPVYVYPEVNTGRTPVYPPGPRPRPPQTPSQVQPQGQPQGQQRIQPGQ